MDAMHEKMGFQEGDGLAKSQKMHLEGASVWAARMCDLHRNMGFPEGDGLAKSQKIHQAGGFDMGYDNG